MWSAQSRPFTLVLSDIKVPSCAIKLENALLIKTSWIAYPAATTIAILIVGVSFCFAGGTSMTSDDEDDEENGPMHGEKLPRKLSNTCRQCAMGFLSFSELSEHNKTCVLRTGAANNADTSDDFDHRNDHDDTDDVEDDEEPDDEEDVVDELVDIDDYRRPGNRFGVVFQQIAADLRRGFRNTNFNNNNNNNNNNKAHEEQRRQRQDAENNNRRYGGGLPDPISPGDDLRMAIEESLAALEAAGGFPVSAYRPDMLMQHQQQQAATGHHVTLEALQNTKVAVAQFAATAMAVNNGAISNQNVLQDLAIVHSSLFTLQHQQMMQMSLIQQLRRQLQISRRSGGGGGGGGGGFRTSGALGWMTGKRSRSMGQSATRCHRMPPYTPSSWQIIRE